MVIMSSTPPAPKSSLFRRPLKLVNVNICGCKIIKKTTTTICEPRLKLLRAHYYIASTSSVVRFFSTQKRTTADGRPASYPAITSIRPGRTQWPGTQLQILTLAFRTASMTNWASRGTLEPPEEALPDESSELSESWLLDPRNEWLHWRQSHSSSLTPDGRLVYVTLFANSPAESSCKLFFRQRAHCNPAAPPACSEGDGNSSAVELPSSEPLFRFRFLSNHPAHPIGLVAFFLEPPSPPERFRLRSG